MAKAGYCEQCQANVWLTDEGECPNGHPVDSISGVYEAPEQIAPPAVAQPAAPRRNRRTLAFVAAGVVGILVLCGVAVAMLKPILGQAVSLTDEWQARLAEDYPGWQMAAFNVRTYSGGDGTQTEYDFSMVPPERDFSVGILYVSEGDGQAICEDEVFRDGGRYHDRAESLLDYIEAHYVDEGKSVGAVIADSDGEVTVNWTKQSRVGPVSTNVGDFDQLEYNESSDTWSVR